MHIFRKNAKKIIFLTISLLILGSFAVAKNTLAAENGYPKLANYYLDWDINSDEEIAGLAKWDLVILSPQALERNPQILAKLREKNPKIKILAYVPIQEITHQSDLLNQTAFWKKIYQAADQNGWWLKLADGSHASYWPGNWFINASSSSPKKNGQSWLDYLPNLVNDDFLKNGNWDGVFYDNVWSGLSWTKQPIDINNDGIAESSEALDKAWQEGLSQILVKTRSLAPNKIIIANSNTNLYNNLLNGRMLESFPSASEGNWLGSMTDYINSAFSYLPQSFIINGSTKNSGDQTDYKDFRLGLTSALLGNGYYSFDYGDQGHNKIWWYDEYNLYLGEAKSEAKNLLNPTGKNFQPGVYQRDYQNALVLVNSTSAEQKVSFDAEYEKIKGEQDPQTNDGGIVKNITLPANDGIVLLRRIEEIKNSPFFNGSFIRVFNSTGDLQRNGFFLYENQFRGSNVIAKKDINNDNKIETIVADESKITIYDENKNVLNSFYPYGLSYNTGIGFDLADIDGDGKMEIITGALKSAAPLVKIFDNQGKEINSGFYAYSKNFTGGINVAVCDFKGNGEKSIVTGAGYLGGSAVKIFNKNGKLLGSAYAYAKNFKGGVYVACGDVNGDKKDEIVTGAGYTGSPQVRIFNNKFQEVGKSFWAYDKTGKNGVRVIANDIDGNGVAEILAATPSTFTTAISANK